MLEPDMSTNKQRLPPIHVWMNFPSHHQSEFFAALRKRGVDLTVTYYEQITADRLAQGWSNPDQLNSWECFLGNSGISASQRLESLRNHVHILPGYGSATTMNLAKQASQLGIKWCHWSEASFSGFRWFIRYFRKRRYARLVNDHALGAFAQGMMARRDFMRWGIQAEKIANLTYSTPSASEAVEPHAGIVEFAQGRRVFLFVGQLNRRKGIDVIIRAFASLRTAEWCLVFVGAAQDDSYVKQAQRCNILPQTLFLPPVKWTDISAVHAAGDVLLLPSRFDGWGAVANEAAALGKSLILSTNCGAAWEIVHPAINGFLVTPGNANSLANAMRYYVAGGTKLLQDHGKESRRIVQHYSADANAVRLIAALHSWSFT